MKFRDVAIVFDAIEKESSRTKITVLLADLLHKANATEASIIAYLSLGSLQPPYLGTQFNFAEKSMLKVVAHLVDKSVAAVQSEAQKHGDLGSVVEHGTWEGSSEILSVHDVYKILHQFLVITGTGSQDIKEEKFIKFLKVLDPLSAKYVVRVVLGKLRLGFSDMTLLDSFSWMETGDKSIRSDLEDAYNVCADIGLIIKTLKDDGLAGIKNMGIQPGIPIRPAAAERMQDAKAIYTKLGACVAQPKLDGFRLQVHVDKRHGHHEKPKIHFFSRNLLDMSEMFPDLHKAVLDLDVQDIVLEGEAIAYEVETGIFLPFQETVKRKRKHNVAQVAQEFPLKLYFFDLLYLNGKSMLDESHHDRRKILVDILDTKKIKDHETIYPIDEVKLHSAKELEDYFELNVSVGLEGIIVKRPDAIYQPGKRNFNWIKLKRQESGSLDDTIDCVILGYYHGHGKRATFGIGALLVGVFNPKLDRFETVAKIGTGLTDQEWKDQKEACDKLKIAACPHNVICAKGLHPDVWVSPEIVCLIRADEITRSPMHTAGATDDNLGFALRFPRLMGYRPDKAARDATTISELKHLFELQFKKKEKK